MTVEWYYTSLGGVGCSCQLSNKQHVVTVLAANNFDPSGTRRFSHLITANYISPRASASEKKLNRVNSAIFTCYSLYMNFRADKTNHHLLHIQRQIKHHHWGKHTNWAVHSLEINPGHWVLPLHTLPLGLSCMHAIWCGLSMPLGSSRWHQQNT